MTKWNCDLCGSSESTPIEAARPYIGDNEPPDVCNKCGFIFVRERRTPEEVAAAWDGIWGDGYTSAWPAVKARLTYVAEWIDQNIGIKNKALLDIGAGEGTFLGIAKRMGATVTGIEPSPGNVQHMIQNGIRAHYGTAESVVLDEKFDIVTISWTLENTGDCVGFLKKARSFLKKDGHLVVATGSRILVPFKKKLGDYFSDNPADTHCFRFSANSLARTLYKAGFATAHANRFVDSDWLVVNALSVKGMAISHDTTVDQPNLYDDPQEVLQFFDDWSEAFP